MARDVEPIIERPSGAVQLAAARLCNFSTGGAAPLKSHVEWINGPFASALKTSRRPWVDIFAYASKSGSAASNKVLSERRRSAVHDLVMKAAPNCGLISGQEEALGEGLSGGGANNNDGYWRAVEVHVYDALPPTRKPDPRAPAPAPDPAPIDWWVNSLSVGGVSIVVDVGGGFADGTIGFENINTHQQTTSNITIAGVSAGVGGGGGGAGELLDDVVKVLARNPVVAKAVTWAANSIAAGRQDWPSGAIGPIFAMPGRGDLSSVDFKGTCLAAFLGGGVGPVSGGLYILFMGKQESLASLAAWVYGAGTAPMVGPTALAASIIYNSRAVAVFAADSVGVGLTIGASANLWVGRIS